MELVSTYWSFAAVAAAVFTMGLVVKRIAHLVGLRPLGSTPGWIAVVYDATLPMHALVVGAAFGMTPLQSPEWVGNDMFGRCLYFMLAGAMCGQIYEAVKRVIQSVGAAKVRNSMRPPAPDSEETES